MRTAVDALLPSFERDPRRRFAATSSPPASLPSSWLTKGCPRRSSQTSSNGGRRRRPQPGYHYLQQFFRWPEEEGEIPSSPMTRMKPPTVVEAPVPVLSGEDRSGLVH